MKETNNRTGKRAAAASAVALVTAASVFVGGLFGTPSELLSQDPAAPNTAYIDTLLPDDDGGDDGDQDELVPEKSRKRNLKAIAREHILRLPLAVRFLLILPLWLLGSAVTALGSSLWTAASPLLDGILGFLLQAVLLLGAFLLAVKSAFPDLPLKKILNRRTIPVLLFAAAALTAADRILSAAWPEYAGVRQAIISGGFLLILAAAVISFSLREQRRRLLSGSAPESPLPVLPDKLRFTDSGGSFSIRTGK